MITDVEYHLFICLLAICMSALGKSFAHFLIELFVFSVLTFVSSLLMLAINPLSHILVNTFSHSVGCLFILFVVSFAVQKPFSLM